MKIGILQTGHSPDALAPQMGDYGEMFTKLLGGNGFDFQIYSVVDGEFPQNAQMADGWLITGSRHGAYEDHDWIPPLEELIRDIRAQGLPMIGICFGHQIIAQALGGKVEKFSGGWSVGPVDYELDGERCTIMAWHQDQVTELPAGARVVGGTDFCRYASMEYDGLIWTMQPHPEFSRDFVDGLIRTRGKGVVPDDQLSEASARLDMPLSQNKMAQKMARYFIDRHSAQKGAS